MLQGTPASPSGPCSLVVSTHRPRWTGGPDRDAQNPHAAVSPGTQAHHRGDTGGPPGRLLGRESDSGQFRGHSETLADFPPDAACYMEAAVAGSSRKKNVFSRDFDKINSNHLDKAHFISGTNPPMDLFYIFLNEM